MSASPVSLETWLSSLHVVKSEVEALYDKHPDTFAVVCFKPFACEPKHQHPPVSLAPRPTHFLRLLPDLVRGVERHAGSNAATKAGEFTSIDLSTIERTALLCGSRDRGDWLFFFYGDAEGYHRFWRVNQVIRNLLLEAAINRFRTPSKLPTSIEPVTWLRLVVEWAIQRQPAMPLTITRFTPDGDWTSNSLRTLQRGEDDNTTIWYTRGIRVFEATRYGLNALEATAAATTKASNGKLSAENLDRKSQVAVPKGKPSKIAQAIAILSENPEWSNKQIAEAVPCNVKYLSQAPKFRAARKAIRDAGRRDIPRGSKGADGSIEAYDDF